MGKVGSRWSGQREVKRKARNAREWKGNGAVSTANDEEEENNQARQIHNSAPEWKMGFGVRSWRRMGGEKTKW